MAYSMHTYIAPTATTNHKIVLKVKYFKRRKVNVFISKCTHVRRGPRLLQCKLPFFFFTAIDTHNRDYTLRHNFSFSLHTNIHNDYRFFHDTCMNGRLQYSLIIYPIFPSRSREYPLLLCGVNRVVGKLSTRWRRWCRGTIPLVFSDISIRRRPSRIPDCSYLN